MSKIKVAILRNEDYKSADRWALSCERYGLEYKIIDLTAANWLQDIFTNNADLYLLRPPAVLEYYKALYDERIYILCKGLGLKTFPSYKECYLYENKKLQSYYLQAQKIPHPHTLIFYNREEASEFVNKSKFPLVAKTSVGGAGSGVQIIRDKNKAKKYIKNAFSKKGIRRRFGPNRVTGSPGIWFAKALKSPKYLLQKLNHYFTIYLHPEREFVIFQEYIPHDYEWRVVKIGDSFFARKKLKYKDMASGTKGYIYANPPLKLLDFTKQICENNYFNCMAIDLFENEKGDYLVNELQTLVGQDRDHIMEVDGKSGRYIYRNNEWVFEIGDFNTNESYDLRLKTALELYEANKLSITY